MSNTAAESLMLEDKLVEIMSQNPRTIEDLLFVRSLRLKSWYIGAGYVRNQVWDYLHSYEGRLILDDVDVIYFDDTDISEETDRKYEEKLRALNPALNWSVKNQARMHIRNNHNPYLDVADAMLRWPETATAVGIRLTSEGKMEVIAPYGLMDLFELKIRQSPYCEDRDIFMKRFHDKRWIDRWGLLKIIEGE